MDKLSKLIICGWGARGVFMSIPWGGEKCLVLNTRTSHDLRPPHGSVGWRGGGGVIVTDCNDFSSEPPNLNTL